MWSGQTDSAKRWQRTILGPMSQLLVFKATLRVTRGGKMALCSPFPARFRLQRILDPCKLPSDENWTKDGRQKCHSRCSHAVKNPLLLAVLAKKKELAIMTETPNYHRIRQFGRIFIEFYNGNLVLAMPQKDSAIGNANPRPVQRGLLRFFWIKRNDPRVVGRFTLNRDYSVNVNSSFVKSNNDILTRDDLVYRES